MTVPVEAPSARRLSIATGIAAAVAAIVLVTVVLPAEYGIDPTGIGARLGLDALSAPPSEAPETAPVPSNTVVEETPAATIAAPALDAVGQPVKPIDERPVGKSHGAFRSDTLSATLPPGKGAEIKMDLQAGEGVVFRWSASAPVAFDLHGERHDAADGEYTSFWIEAGKREASGTFTAPFEGRHGWYWLNRSAAPIEVTVEVSGFQEKLFIPGHE
jgi:hypothetical protein